MNYLDVCAGISAASAAWLPLGWKCLGYSEIDPYASAVLSYRRGAGRPRWMPDPSEAPDEKEAKKRAAAIKALDRVPWAGAIPNFGDFPRIMDEPDLEALLVEVGVHVAGTPCQDFSLAGLRKSLSGARGNLTLQFLRLCNAIDDLRRDAGRPEAFHLWENVPGVLSTDDNAFGSLLGGLVGSDRPLDPGKVGGWTDSGVVAGPRRVAAWRVLDTQFFGLAQRRRRVFVLARGGAGAWTVADALLPIIDSVRGNPPPSREAREAPPEAARAGAGGPSFAPDVAGTIGSLTGGYRTTDLDQNGAFIVERPAGGGGGGGDDRSDIGRGGGGPSSVAHAPDLAPTLLSGGNQTGGVRPPRTQPETAESLIVMASGQANAEITHNIAPTLNTIRDQPVVFSVKQGPVYGDQAGALDTDALSQAIAFTSKDDGGDATENLAPTLRAMNHADSRPNGGGQIAVAYGFEPRDRGDDGRGYEREVSFSEDVAPTINTVKPGAVAISAQAFSMRGRDGENMIEPEAGEVAPALRTGGGGSDKAFVAVSFQERGRPEGRSLEVGGDVAYALTAPQGGGRAQEKLVATINFEHGLAPHGSLELRDLPEAIGAAEEKGHTAVLAYNLSPGSGSDGKPSATEAEVAAALTATGEAERNGRGTHVVDARAYQLGQITHPENRQNPKEGDPAPTLCSDGQAPHVAFSFKPSHYTRDKDGAPSPISPPLTADADKGDQDPVLLHDTAVRRLTCRECERLQGFPDDFTLIPWASSNRDERDLAETVQYLLDAGYSPQEASELANTPDGPRYRTLGNSKGVTVVQEIGRRIEAIARAEGWG